MVVNPNTMQKALCELEAMGLIRTERTSGKYVTDDLELIARFREEYALITTQKYLKMVGGVGLTADEIIGLIKKEIENGTD